MVASASPPSDRANMGSDIHEPHWRKSRMVEISSSGSGEGPERVTSRPTLPKRTGLERGYSAHSMRATFITTALENGAGLEDVQLAAGHADPSTTKLYDRRGYNPEKSASFFANY
jgi:integrase